MDDLKINLTVEIPNAPRKADDKIDRLVQKPSSPSPLVRPKRLPVQPADVPEGYVYAGAEDGLVPYSGVKPRAGDLIAIVGGTTRRYVTSPLAGEPMRWPTFIQGCRCQCPGNAGTVVYSTSARGVPNLIALDATSEFDGTALQLFGMNELAVGDGIAVAIDPDPPHDLYAMSDLRGLFQRLLDSQPNPVRGYFTLVRYEIQSEQYTPVEYTPLTDPGFVLGPGAIVIENDPPAIGTNFLAVIDGVPFVTMQKAPARYLSIQSGIVTEHSLLFQGDPYDFGLRGNIVTVPQSPAPRRRRYVMATDGSQFELLEFNAENNITRRYPIPAGLAFPLHLAAFCNRVWILNGSTSEL